MTYLNINYSTCNSHRSNFIATTLHPQIYSIGNLQKPIIAHHQMTGWTV